MPVSYNRVPEALRCLPQWVNWKTIVRDGNQTKVPFQPSGLAAKANDPSTWTTFEAVVAVVDKFDGIGFVFSASDPFCGIDLDGCRDPETGIVADWAREIITSIESYAEVSPSGTGVKLWVIGKWKHAGHKKSVKDAPAIGGKKPAIEVYDRLRYFAVTGHRLQGHAEITDQQVALDMLHSVFWVSSPPVPPPPASDFRSNFAVIDRARAYLSKVPPAVSGSGGHNATFHAACILILGFVLSADESLGLLLEWNRTCEPPWSESELRHKIDGAMQQTGERGYLRNVSPQNFASVKVPHYKAPPPKPEPVVTTLRDAANKYLNSIRDGATRLITTGIPELDQAIGGGAEPGEMFLMAARPSHGKSAVALQMVHHWTLSGIPSVFVSEEMSAIAIGKRTVQFATDVPQEAWSERMQNVEDDSERHFFGRADCIVVEQCRTSEAVADAIRAAKRDSDVQCAIVDYAQLLGSPGKSRYEQVTNTSIVLKQVASETGILLVALCQLSRQIESRNKFVPQMSDLRETGQLEQDADVIVFGVWPHRIDHTKNPNEYQFFVAKNRNRPINSSAFVCRFEPSRQRFLESTGSSYSDSANGSNKDLEYF